MLEAAGFGLVGIYVASVLWEFVWPYVIAKLLGIGKDVTKFGEWAGGRAAAASFALSCVVVFSFRSV